jgi:hypothetical protein
MKVGLLKTPFSVHMKLVFIKYLPEKRLSKIKKYE